MGYKELFDQYHAQQSNYVSYAVQMVMYVVSAVGPRVPGSAAEQSGQKAMMADLRNYVDTVVQEPFDFHPKAFMGFICIASFCMIAAVFFYNFKIRWASFVLNLISVIMFTFEFLMYKEFVDPIFPAGSSSNVLGIINATGEVKRIAYFNGHTDSMWQWQYNYLGGGHLLVVMIVGAVGGMFIFQILQIVYYKEFQNWIAILEICFLPFYVAIAYFTNFTIGVEGANDNLTGCATAMAVAKYLKDNNIRFENTEVRILLTGCEEAGLRGAKRFAALHPIANENAEVGFFAFDTIRDLDSMAVYRYDMTGTVTNDIRICSIMKRAGELGGLDLPYSTVYCGSSDAAAMTQGGYPAACFAAMDPTPADYYHTVRDRIQNMVPAALGHSIDVAMGSLFIFDEEGLNGEIISE